MPGPDSKVSNNIDMGVKPEVTGLKASGNSSGSESTCAACGRVTGVLQDKTADRRGSDPTAAGGAAAAALQEGSHDRSNENIHGHCHGQDQPHSHPHAYAHNHPNQKAVSNRLARAIGHLEAVKRMVDNGDDCAAILIQLAAVRSAINNAGKVILTDHINHCIVEAVEDGDMAKIEELNEAIRKFV